MQREARVRYGRSRTRRRVILLIYADTSVIAAYYCPESISEQADALLRRHPTPSICWLTEVELASAIRRKVREGGLSAIDSHRILSRFGLHVSQSMYRVLPLHRQHYRMAQEWLEQVKTPLRSLDALHLARAMSAGIPLATADKRQRDAGEAVGLPVIMLEC